MEETLANIYWGRQPYILQSKILRGRREEVLQALFSKCKTMSWEGDVTWRPSHFGYTVEYSLQPMVWTAMEGHSCLERREKKDVNIRIFSARIELCLAANSQNQCLEYLKIPYKFWDCCCFTVWLNSIKWMTSF